MPPLVLEQTLAGKSVTFLTEGHGEADPVAPNVTAGGKDNPAGRKRNRRVEIHFER